LSNSFRVPYSYVWNFLPASAFLASEVPADMEDSTQGIIASFKGAMSCDGG
jgi:hypothetical protein